MLSRLLQCRVISAFHFRANNFFPAGILLCVKRMAFEFASVLNWPIRTRLLAEIRLAEMKYLYHASRIIFGAWFLYSGLMHFFWPSLQPLGDEPAAIAFTKALMASGLFGWIKAIEVVTGITILLNRAMPLTIIAIIPLNIVIVYWNLVLDKGVVEWAFGVLTIVFNAILAWPWRGYFWQLFAWKGKADFSLDPKFERR